MPREQFTLQPPSRFDEAAFRGLHRELNLRLHRIAELFDAAEKKPKFAGVVDAGRNRVTQIATAVADDDAVPLHQLRAEVLTILKNELDEQTSEADDDTLAGGDDETSDGGGTDDSDFILGVYEDTVLVEDGVTSLNFTEPDAVLVVGDGVGGATVDMRKYLLLAGRPGIANDALLSTDAIGTLTGSDDAGGVLALLGSSNATRGPVRVNDAAFTHASGVFGALQVGGTITFNGGTRFNWLELGQVAGTPRVFNVTTAPIGAAVFFQPSIRNTTPGSAVDLGNWFLFANVAQFRTNNTIGETVAEVRVLADAPTFNQITGGDLTCAVYSTVDSRPTISTGATITTRRGFRMLDRSGAGVQTNVIGFDYEAQTAATLNIAFRNQDVNASIRSTGPVRIGDQTTPTEALQVAGNVEILPSPGASLLRLYEPAASGGNFTAFQAQAQAGNVSYVLPAAAPLTNGESLTSLTTGFLSWAAMQPLDADLTAYAALATTGIVVRTGAGTVATRSLAVTDTASVDFTLTNADGVAGNPTITASVLAAGVDHGGLGGLSDDDHAQYLLLAGRAGTTNDPIISTSGGTGTITGSTSGGGFLVLDGSQATLNVTEAVRIACKLAVEADTAHIPVTLGTYAIIDVWNTTHTTAVGDNPSLRALSFAPTITWGDDPSAIQLLRNAATHTMASNAARTLTNGSVTVQSVPIFTPVGASGAWTLAAQIVGLNTVPVFTNAGAGNTAVANYGLTHGGQLNTNWVITDWAAVRALDPTGSGGTITNLFGVDVAALTSRNSTVVAAFNSAIAAGTGKFFLRDTGGAQSAFAGLITTYRGVATVNKGVPSEVATSALTTQAAAITATTIYAVPAGVGAGLYRISWVASVTRAATTSCVLGGATGFQVIYTDNNDSVVKTSNPTTVTAFTSAINATGTTVSGCVVAYCKASTNLQYAFGYTSVGGTTMQYDLTITVEAL